MNLTGEMVCVILRGFRRGTSTMPRMPIRAVGMVWYRREDYPRILTIMADSKKLPDTFDQWEKSAKAGESHMQAQGALVIRAVIDPETFPAWCKARGLNVDAKARTSFSSEAAFEATKRTH